MKQFIVTLIFIFTLGAMLYAQSDIYATAGRTKVLQWKSAGDYSAYDSLLFVVVNSSDERVIQKDLTQSYALGYTTMVCTLYVSDTEDLTADASYDYDIAAYGADTVTVRRGKLNLLDPVQTSFNGTALPGGTRITTVSLENGSEPGDIAVWDTTLTRWMPVSRDSIWSFLSVSDTVENAIALEMLDFKNYSLTFLYPTTNEDVLIDRTHKALTIDSVFCSTKDSSITFNLYYASTRNGSTTGVFGSNQAITIPATLTTFANATIPANNYLIFQFYEVAGLLGEEFYCKIYYR